VVASAAVLGGALLPWHRSGRVHRNGFALARAADDLGLVSSTAYRVLFVAAYLLPLLGALTLAAAVARWHRATGLGACIVGVLAVAATMVALHSIARHHQPGPFVTGLAGVAAIACGLQTLRGGDNTDVGHA
jgi:hypothetical protein